MKNFIITTDCQRGQIRTNSTLAQIAIELENGGHKVKGIRVARDSEAEVTPGFKWQKIEEPPVPKWLYTASSGDPSINGKKVIASGYREAAAQLGCKVQFAAPFRAHCSAPNGRATLLTWSLDPVE